MQISMTTSSRGFDNLMKRYEKMGRMIDNTLMSELTSVKDSGLASLKDATPVDSGKTKESWDGKVKKTSGGVDIVYTNSNKTKTDIPIPILIRNGHITGTGGYVPPNDFMTPVLNNVAKEASKKVKEVMSSG